MKGTTRAMYQSWIWNYKKRRDVADKEYYEALHTKRTLTIKINLWQKAINRIDERNKKIKDLVKKVNAYFHVLIESKKMDKPHILARKIYFKVGMESKIQGAYLAQFIGKCKRSAFRNRQTLTRDFSTKPNERQIFHSFKKYIEQ